MSYLSICYVMADDETSRLRKAFNIKTFFNLILTSLRDLLALQELKQTGKNTELLARAFGTYELKAPKKFSQEEIDKKLKEEYQLRIIETLDKHQPQEDKKSSVPSDLDPGLKLSFRLLSTCFLHNSAKFRSFGHLWTPNYLT